ncbi:hypothetical protein Btru_000657 [Bulinus truncatus]|nr:hypothetical protein Btru_000657 [Bulinus truncatus]
MGTALIRKCKRKNKTNKRTILLYRASSIDCAENCIFLTLMVNMSIALILLVLFRTCKDTVTARLPKLMMLSTLFLSCVLLSSLIESNSAQSAEELAEQQVFYTMARNRPWPETGWFDLIIVHHGQKQVGLTSLSYTMARNRSV